MGGGSRVGGGKVKGQLSLRPVATLVVRERMKKAPAVQSGRALPMGTSASPPGYSPNMEVGCHVIFPGGHVIGAIQKLKTMFVFTFCTRYSMQTMKTLINI